MTNSLIIFLPPSDFYGEFGFDWVEWDIGTGDLNQIQKFEFQTLEYIYDDIQHQFIHVNEIENPQKKIFKNYKKFKINEVDNYYMPWLSIFPNQTIQLETFVIALNDADISTDFVTFDNHDAYLVTIDGQTNENIRYIPDGDPKEIKITCIKPSPETEIIARDGKNNIIGKICVKDNTSIYNLNVRVVCVVEDTPKKDEEINELIEIFNSGKVGEFLNKNSLNQALIKTKVEIDKKYHIAIHSKEIEEVFGCLKQSAEIKNRATADLELFDRLSDEYHTRFGMGGQKFKGILVFINRIAFEGAVGLDTNYGGITRKINSTEIIMFKECLSAGATYAHEIGHALGLAHVFLDENEREDVNKWKSELNKVNNGLEESKETVEFQEQKLLQYKHQIKENQDKIESLKLSENQNNPETAAKIESLEALIEDDKRKDIEYQNSMNKETRQIARQEKRQIELKGTLKTYKQNSYKFRQGFSFNFMDYMDSSRFLFTQWQWKIMQERIKKTHGHLS